MGVLRPHLTPPGLLWSHQPGPTSAGGAGGPECCAQASRGAAVLPPCSPQGEAQPGIGSWPAETRAPRAQGQPCSPRVAHKPRGRVVTHEHLQRRQRALLRPLGW